MSPSALSALLAITAATAALAQPDPADLTPLYSKHYAYPTEIPYQVDYNTAAIRGPQVGYNICNSTTENQNSMCQTAFVNHIDDFCLWAPPKPNSTIGDTEGQEVAWCTKPGHGTRVIPAGVLQGAQLIRTPDYIQIAGYIDQTKVNMAANDYGGELDPHGADLRGNPIGGLMYSNAFPKNNNVNTYHQVNDWTVFIGANVFCLKVCDPAGKTPGQYCQNIYDRLGCTYNVPNHAKKGTFEVCDGDNMTPPGIYTGSNGQTLTYSQPPESSGPITTVPYTPAVPSSSNCHTYRSTDLYRPTPTGGPATTGKPSKSGSGTRPGSGGAAASAFNRASVVGISSVATIAGVVFAMVFLS